MKILMLVNWEVKNLEAIPKDLQPPNYYIKGSKYWFFKYWPEEVEVDVIDIGSSWFTKKVEKKILKFYILQTFRVLLKLKQYDIVFSHGAQSGIFLSLLRRIFKFKGPKHIVFDIGSFNSAKEVGFINKFMRVASKSMDGVIYHTSSQIDYYKKCFPWLVEKSKFIHFGTDLKFFTNEANIEEQNCILCVGYLKRDWTTLISAFEKLDRKDVFLKIVGKTDLNIKSSNIIVQEFIPIDELIEEIQKAMIVVVPLEHFNYSFGQMTLLQAMALKKAIIAAKVPSLIDYVEDNKTCLLYESKSVEDLVEKLSKLIDDSALRDYLAANARKSIEDKYNEKNMTIKIYDFLKEIM